MIDIRNIPPPATRLDPAPQPVSRAEPGATRPDKLRGQAPRVERRRNPDRRSRRPGKGPMDRRTGADRRRNSVNIEV
jgi:hypothetical protein